MSGRPWARATGDLSRHDATPDERGAQATLSDGFVAVGRFVTCQPESSSWVMYSLDTSGRSIASLLAPGFLDCPWGRVAGSRHTCRTVFLRPLCRPIRLHPLGLRLPRRGRHPALTLRFASGLLRRSDSSPPYAWPNTLSGACQRPCARRWTSWDVCDFPVRLRRPTRRVAPKSCQGREMPGVSTAVPVKWLPSGPVRLTSKLPQAVSGHSGSLSLRPYLSPRVYGRKG